ncbi:MBL fold metallo-hydrolase [Candidatus Uhrbacteria bacterium]|nr:MBL fold metallo-hydrolase [Candidatus Uhrbacteria bacterium]
MKKRLLFIAAAASISTALWIGRAHRQDDVVMRFFDIGQGDAAMISRGRTQVLIDAGPDRAVLGKLGRAMPFFDRHIDLAVLTHPHADHFVGFIGVFERYQVDRLLVSGADNGSPDYRAFAAAAKAEGAEIIRANPGDKIEIGDATIEVLWASPRPQHGDLNDASVVFRLQAGGQAALFMGDAGENIERALLAAGIQLQAQILKVGHHGSRTATGADFLAAVRPEEAIVSVGKNTYGHPSFSALERLKAAGVRIRRTDRDGDITVKFRRPP